MTWRRKEATARQKALLFELGMLPYRSLTRGEAANLISRVSIGNKKRLSQGAESNSIDGAPRPRCRRGPSGVADVKQRKGKKKH